MFKKILVVEDIDSISLSLVKMLEEAGKAEVYSCKYCDDAWLKIKGAVYNQAPFDLLITDLSFSKDHRNPVIQGGEQLVKQVKAEFPEIKIVVYSVENRYSTIKKIVDEYRANAYVSKGRNSVRELFEAIDAIQQDQEVYLSANIREVYHNSELVQLQDEDITILSFLSQGLSQSEISSELRQVGSSTSSVSSVEKRINRLKVYFEVKNTVHLISVSKDLGLI